MVCFIFDIENNFNTIKQSHFYFYNLRPLNYTIMKRLSPERKSSDSFSISEIYRINVRENRRGNQEWTTQRNWQYWEQKTQDKVKQNKNTTQYIVCTGHQYTQPIKMHENNSQ